MSTPISNILPVTVTNALLKVVKTWGLESAESFGAALGSKEASRASPALPALPEVGREGVGSVCPRSLRRGDIIS